MSAASTGSEVAESTVANYLRGQEATGSIGSIDVSSDNVPAHIE
ncbi:MAG: hypothetical protein WAK29_22985 [Terriglobales bacterium]